MKKALSTAALCFFAATQLFAQQPSWTTKAPMITPRVALACAALHDTIYAFGGNDGNTISSAAEAYNVKTNTWRSLPSMPTARGEMVAEQVGGKLYVIGGYNANIGGSLSTTEIYDPATNSWSAGAPMPGPRSQMVSCVLNNKIYVTGGWPNSFSDLYIYDPATNTWSSGTDITYGVMQCNSGVAADGQFYVLGGRYGQTLVDYNQAYNPATGTWMTRASLPIPVFSGAAALYHHKIHLLGGGSDWQAYYHLYNLHYVYDPATNSWTSALNIPAYLASQSAITVGDTLYMIGGKGNNAAGTVSYISGATYAYYSADSTAPAGINSVNEKMASFYPNPAVNEVHIMLKENRATEKTVMLRDYAGKVMATMNFSGLETTVNTSNIPSGIYWLTVTDGSASSTEKLVIMH